MAAKSKKPSTAVEKPDPETYSAYKSSVAQAIVFAEAEKKDADKVVADLKASIDTSTPEGYSYAGEALKVIAARYTVVETKRKDWTGELKRIAADIDATLRPALTVWKELEEWLKEKVGQKAVAVERQRSDLVREAGIAAAQGNPKRAEKLLAQAASLELPKIDGVTAKAVWTGEVTNADLLPREYLMPNVDKLKAVTEAAQGDPKIDGWHAYPDAAVRTTRKGA